jgi:uncharacterized protein with von Willebrand factor type A (vWA) domain
MGELILHFWQRYREKRLWRKRLEPVMDRLMAERQAEEEAGDLATEQDSEADAGQASEGNKEGGKPDVEMMELADSSSFDDVPEDESAPDGDPFFQIEPVDLEGILSNLMQASSTAGTSNSAPVKAHEVSSLPLAANVLFAIDPLLIGNSLLEDLPDEQVEDLQPELRRLVRRHLAGRRQLHTPTRAPRRKHIDPRATVKRMAQTGGTFQGFRYRPSPSDQPAPVDEPHLLVIADVSGSMGRYAGIILYLLSCLEEIAQVDSYIFSDATTYASDLLGTGSFREQFTRLKDGASSWEYGTRLGQALQDVNRDRRCRRDTHVVLLTDGGFSLIGSDWEDTVRELLEMHRQAGRLTLVTPNPGLLAEGDACADALWNVERDPRPGDSLLHPALQKTARYGLLTRCSAETLLCQTSADLARVLQTLLKNA